MSDVKARRSDPEGIREKAMDLLGTFLFSERSSQSPKAEHQSKLLGFASRLPVVAFDFTVSRHRDGPDAVLRDYKGTLLGDCWSGFQKLDIRSDSRITFAACWAHARRKIDECRGAFPIQVARLESLIRMLYDVEDQIKQLDDAARLARRQSLSRHVLGLIDEYLSSDAMTAPAVLPTSNLGLTAAYVRRHWEALNRFTDDARIPIDNNGCEQLMKRSTGRKNWLFKASLAPGERAANLMTIVGSAVCNDLDVHAYLDDVLRRVLAGETQWPSLAPHVWKAEHPEAIRIYRKEERRQAADRKRTRRASRRMLGVVQPACCRPKPPRGPVANPSPPQIPSRRPGQTEMFALPERLSSPWPLPTFFLAVSP